MSKPNGGPAFPFQYDRNGGSAYEGATLRDYFAAAALPALISEAERTGADPVRLAATAYQLADAMLRARSAV